LYFAFVIDVLSLCIVGLSVSPSMRFYIELEALKRALYDRGIGCQQIHHSDDDRHDLKITTFERTGVGGIKPSAGSRGEPHDNAVADTMIDPCKRTSYTMTARDRAWRTPYSLPAAGPCDTTPNGIRILRLLVYEWYEAKSLMARYSNLFELELT
jgi:putative transposase